MAERAGKIDIEYPVDAKNIAISKDPFYPDAYVISLPLDSAPSYVWQTLFEQELRISTDFWDRKVMVVGNEVKLITTRDRVEEKLSWLEGLIEAANRRVDEYNSKTKVEREVKETKIIDEQAIRTELSSWLLRRVSR